MHIPLGEKQTLTTYRKISIASWHHPRDPTTYSWLELPVEEAEKFLDAYQSDVKPSLTVLIAKIVANCLEEHPALNHLLRLDALYRRTRTDVFITALLGSAQGRDLSGFTLRDVPHHSLGDLARLSHDAAERLKEGGDADTRRTNEVTAHLPVWLLRILIWVQALAHYTLNVSLHRFGIPDDRFGSVVITNFGILGIENGLVPLSPYCRVPLLIGVGRPRPKPVVKDGEVVVAECVTISFTFDHRYADGIHGGLMMRRFQKIFLKPTRYAAIFEADSGKTTDTPAPPTE